jgi:hypothetical protein
MHCVRFKTTIPASERAETVHALDRSATVTDAIKDYHGNIKLHNTLLILFVKI